MTSFRDTLINGIMERIPYVKLNGHPTKRLANNVNFPSGSLMKHCF